MHEFKEIYNRYSTRVYRFLLALTGDAYMAEELLQETFYQAFVHMDKFEGRCSVFTWLCQIGKNAWYKECKRNKRLEHPEEIDREGRVESPEDEVIRKDEQKRMRNAIFNLSQPYQDVVVMHVFGEIPLKEIGAQFGKSESWAYVTYYRAKNMIIEEVGE